eukprot:TRINITY_DN5918_c0_g1_i1.p1 TRINITY_DN5918_c0_g1~~TRINITY_DN5918_c0_g1_i1.p1  ORF type:complete len:569 (-),score=66.93 TRINITY_DN5918_c0_g1_i1:90-1796(-)
MHSGGSLWCLMAMMLIVGIGGGSGSGWGKRDREADAGGGGFGFGRANAQITTSAGVVVVSGLGSPATGPLFTALATAYTYSSDFVSITYATQPNTTQLHTAVFDSADAFVVASGTPKYLFLGCDDYLISSFAPYSSVVYAIPVAGYAVVLPYRLDAANGKQLVLDMALLGDVLLGRVTNWNDSRFAELNPTIAFPDLPIHAVLYQEPVVATAILSTALSQVVGDWNTTVTPPSGIDVVFPVASSPQTMSYVASNQTSYLTLLQSVDGTLGYAISPEVASASFTSCALRIQQSTVLASVDTITRAMQYYEDDVNAVTTFSGSITNPGDPTAWPLSGLLHVAVNLGSLSLQCDTQSLLLSFLTWVLVNNGVRSTMTALQIAPLTVAIRTNVESRFATAQCDGKNINSELVVPGTGLTSVAPAWQALTRIYTLTGAANVYADFDQITDNNLLTTYLLDESVEFVAYNSPISDAVYAQAPDILEIPAFGLGLAIVCNIPELADAVNTSQLVLTANVVAGIYMNDIVMWNDSRIAKLNPTLAHLLPGKPILILVRNASIGFTEVFTAGGGEVG